MNFPGVFLSLVVTQFMAGQMLVGVEVMRAKYRDNFEFPREPGRVVTPISFNIWDKFHL